MMRRKERQGICCLLGFFCLLVLLGSGCFEVPLLPPESGDSEHVAVSSEDDLVLSEEDDVVAKSLGIVVLTVQVKDAESGEFLKDAVVSLTGSDPQYTDVSGQCRFEIPPGKYTITVRRKWYRDFVRTLSLTRRSRYTVRISLRPMFATLKGKVTDMGGKPLKDVRLVLRGTLDEEDCTFTEMARNGSYAFRRIPPGVYILEAFKEGYRFEPVTVTLQPRTVRTLHLRMSQEKNVALWTIMVYLAADNDLFRYSQRDLREMQAVGSTDDVHVVVFWDPLKSSAGYYFVARDSLVLLRNLGNGNSGDSIMLQDFIRFAKERYPARRYALILWNHGAGWRRPPKGMCWDETSGNDFLSLSELAHALREGGVHFDLIGMDACFMALLEVAYEIKDHGDILLASQAEEPGDGWDYTYFLHRLTRNPGMSARALALEILNGYFSSCGTSENLTLSAVDLARVDLLVQAVDDLARLLYGTENSSFVPGDSLYISKEYGYVDIARLVAFLALKPQYGSVLQKIRNALASTVIANRASGVHQGSGGLSLYLPYNFQCPPVEYQDLLFTRDSFWDEFLKSRCSR